MGEPKVGTVIRAAWAINRRLDHVAITLLVCDWGQALTEDLDRFRLGACLVDSGLFGEAD